MDTPELVEVTFYALAAIAVIIKLIRWMRAPESKSKSFHDLQVRYFMALYAHQFSLFVSGPFLFRRYVDCNITLSTDANLKIMFNWCTAAVSFASSTCLRKFGHKTMILVLAASTVLSHVFRTGETITMFAIGNFFRAISASLGRVVFDDWYLHEVSQIKDCPNSQFIFSENNAFLGLIMSIITAPIGDFIYRQYGSRMVFAVCAIAGLIAFIPIIFSVRVTNAPTGADSSQSIVGVLKSLIRAPTSSLNLFMMMETLYGTCVFVYAPSIPSYFTSVGNVPMGKLMSVMSIAALLSVQLANILHIGQRAHHTIVSILATATSLLAMSFTFEDKNVLFGFCCSTAVFESASATMIANMRKTNFPSNIRGHLLGISRLLVSLESSACLLATKPLSYSSELIMYAGLLVTSAAIGGVLMTRTQPKRKDL